MVKIKLIAKIYSTLYTLLGLFYMFVVYGVFIAEGDYFGAAVISLVLAIGYVPALYVLLVVGWKKDLVVNP